MLSLTKFAAIARQYGVPFEVRFTANASFVWIGGTSREWQLGSAQDKSFYADLRKAGARLHTSGDGMIMSLESLT